MQREPVEPRIDRGRDVRVRRLLGDDWDLVCAARANVLLAGPDDMTRTTVAALRPYLPAPVVTARTGERLTLPPRGQVGTIIVDDICTLALVDQRRLLAWLEHTGGRTHVVSTTSIPVVPMIAAGAFLEALYYRLNTVYVDVTGADRASRVGGSPQSAT